MEIWNLIPSLGSPEALLDILMRGQWHVDHGSIERFPRFLQPRAEGSLSSIEKLMNWPHFDIGYRDRQNRYHQANGAGNSAGAYYEMGALVRSTSIDEMVPEAKSWLSKWARALGVQEHDLRFNSWAVRGENGIHWHFDPEDVIHFQIKGDKLLKFLLTDETRFADLHTKRGEKFKAARQDFSKAHSEIVREGTITVIPRGVWHWSESKSAESFAVALCVNPQSHATMLTQSLYQRLRMLEKSRMPVYGDECSKKRAMAGCVEEALMILQDFKGANGAFAFTEDRKSVFHSDQMNSFYFQISPRARFFQNPLRMFIDKRELAFQSNDEIDAVLKAIYVYADGFHIRGLQSQVPGIDMAVVTEVISALVASEFLNFQPSGGLR